MYGAGGVDARLRGKITEIYIKERHARSVYSFVTFDI